MPIINPDNIEVTYPDLPNAICIGKALDALVPAYPKYEFHVKKANLVNVRYENENIGDMGVGWRSRIGNTFKLMNPRVKELNWRKGYYETASLHKYMEMFRRTMVPVAPEKLMVGAVITLEHQLKSFRSSLEPIFGRRIVQLMYDYDLNHELVVATIDAVKRLLGDTIPDQAMKNAQKTYELSHSLIRAADEGNYILVRPRGTQLLIQLSGDAGVFVRDRIKSDTVNAKFALLKVLDPETAIADVGYRLTEDLFFIIAYLNNGDAVI